MTLEERILELSPLPSATFAEHIMAITLTPTGGGSLSDITGYINSKGISAKMINEALSVGGIGVSGASGTVDNPETVSGSISKKIIR